MTAVVGNENPLLSFAQSGTWGGVRCASLYFEEFSLYSLESFCQKTAYGRNKMCFNLRDVDSVCI